MKYKTTIIQRPAWVSDDEWAWRMDKFMQDCWKQHHIAIAEADIDKDGQKRLLSEFPSLKNQDFWERQKPHTD